MKSLRYVLVVLFVVVIGREIPHAQHVHGIPDFCQGSADTVRSGQTMVLSGKVIKGCIRVEAERHADPAFEHERDRRHDLRAARIASGRRHAPGAARQRADHRSQRFSEPIDRSRRVRTGARLVRSVRLHGLPKTPFARVTQEPRAGQGQIFAPTTGWRPGDRLVLPGTHQPAPEGPEFKPQVETAQVIVASNDVVTIQPALAFDHLGAREMDGTLRFLPHVGNLTRSIRIRSENPAGTRWHVIFVDRADVDIRYVSFVNLGRTTTARALRIEPASGGIRSTSIMCSVRPSPQPNGRQFTLIGNVIEDGSKWGITVHNSHYGLIQDNVVYNTGGAGIMTEDGSETGNIFEHNFVVAPTGPGGDDSDLLLGRESSGLWFRGPHNVVRNNVVANTLSNAIVYVNSSGASGVGGTAVIPEFQGANPATNGRPVDNSRVPLGEFSGNEMYSSMYGAIFWDVMASCCLETWEGPTTLIKNTTLWHMGRYGAFPYGTNRMLFEDWTHLNDPRILSERARESDGVLVRRLSHPVHHVEAGQHSGPPVRNLDADQGGRRPRHLRRVTGGDARRGLGPPKSHRTFGPRCLTASPAAA